jgi:hypothetical protein
MIRSEIHENAKEVMISTLARFGIDAAKLNVNQNMEGLINKESNFSPEIAHMLLQARTMGLRSDAEVVTLYSRSMGDNQAIAEETRQDIIKLMKEVTDNGLVSDLPSHQEERQPTIN